MGDVALVKDIAIDLGTGATQIFVRGQGVVVDEPTVVAIDRSSGDVVEAGVAAVELAENNPDRLDLVSPMRNGLVADAAKAQQLISRLLKPYSGGFRDRVRLVIAVSSTASPIERRSLREAAKRAGASDVHLIEHVMAAALGGDLPLHEPVGTMVVDVGAGVTEAALLSLGYIVASSSVRSGGHDIDGEIKQLLRRDYGVVVSDRIAEEIKLAVSESAGDESVMIEARGRLSVDGSTVTAILEREDVQPLLDAHIAAAAEAVRATLIHAPPELGQDLFTRGVHLAGGGARLAGLQQHLIEEFELPVHVLADPERVVVIGAAKCLEAVGRLKDLFVED